MPEYHFFTTEPVAFIVQLIEFTAFNSVPSFYNIIDTLFFSFRCYNV